MRDALKFVFCLTLFFTACHSGGSSSNPLIGTRVTADSPIPAGCSSKIVFTEKTMYYESPGIPNLMPASKGTVNLSITHKLGLLLHDCFDFVPGDVERDVHGALARAFRRSFSMSLCSRR